MSRYRSDEVKHAEDKCKLANRVFALERELENVSRDRDEWKQEHENLLSVRDSDLAALSSQLTALQAQLEAAEMDAARYRWLRDGNNTKHSTAMHIASNLYGLEWDAAIDAALAQNGKE